MDLEYKEYKQRYMKEQQDIEYYHDWKCHLVAPLHCKIDIYGNEFDKDHFAICKERALAVCTRSKIHMKVHICSPFALESALQIIRV